MLEHLISCNKLDENARVKMRDTLLRRHRHQKPQGIRKGLSNIIGKNRPSNSQSNSSASNARKSSTMSLPTTDKSKDNGVYATFPSGKKADSDRILPFQVIFLQHTAYNIIIIIIIIIILLFKISFILATC